MMSPTHSDRNAFYGAAVMGLKALDARETTARRFGPDADARWQQFSGALGVTDRLDILLRDAAITWGTAFSPAEAFGLFGLADDEPFGPDWRSLDEAAATRLIASTPARASSSEVAKVLGLSSAVVGVPEVAPATKLVVAGASAVLSAARAFDGRPDLSWSDQVLVVSNTWAVRQLAGLIAVIQGGHRRTALIRSEGASTRGHIGFQHIDWALVTSDAEPECEQLVKSWGAREA